MVYNCLFDNHFIKSFLSHNFLFFFVGNEDLFSYHHPYSKFLLG